MAVLESARFKQRCSHNTFVIDETLNTVECRMCGKELNPMWVLNQLCSQEARANRAVSELENLADKAKSKNRCKCEKCGQMTRIQK